MRDKNWKRQVSKYVITDYFAAAFSWVSFFLFRKIIIAKPLEFSFVNDILYDSAFLKGIVVIPLFWLLLYYVAGEYHNIFRRSRLQELGRTIFIASLGVILIFFVLILDDTIVSYKNYYQSFFYLLGTQFTLTYFPRLLFTARNNHLLQNQIIGFPTLIIGSNKKALKLYEDLQRKPRSVGNQIVGYVTINDSSDSILGEYLPHLGTINDLIDIINERKIEEAIIAIESSERKKIQQILVKTKATNAIIKAIPDLLDIISGSVRMSSLFGVPLIELSHEFMPAWQENVKRVIDVVSSVFALIILSPVYLFLALGVKLTSKGPILYSHYRVGRYSHPFKIYKFRSMFIDAEAKGPALSSQNDPRITKFGKFMRKMRFDELPQFYNVLVGDMSIVGPRPERQYFIDQITARAPHYLMLFKVRPGITSWGQVKFGYAENVDEMVERLKFDIIYLENMSLYVDLKIMIYTVKTVLEASGK
ncbi:MAG: sugar transferase [Salinivirgaceae bacterium]|jgi:exopolysaccharide biosynthesis polyprenyl glycosylphosphotransferase|nr:sugar transferase [Salinivirgaceae bacterium]